MKRTIDLFIFIYKSPNGVMKKGQDFGHHHRVWRIPQKFGPFIETLQSLQILGAKNTHNMYHRVWTGGCLMQHNRNLLYYIKQQPVFNPLNAG